MENVDILESFPEQQQKEKGTALAQRLNSSFIKLKTLIGFGDQKALDLQRELESVKADGNSLVEHLVQTEAEIEVLKREELKILPLTNEEKKDHLKPEFLASLSTEEYIDLWRRLNPYFLSHVTRQGFRDHGGMNTHFAGMQEFHNGFLSVMEDQKLLRSPWAVEGLKSRDESTIRDWLAWVLEAPNETQARERLKNLLHEGLASAPKYPDKTAVHFASQVIADNYYGGESDNEVFFVFPADILCSKYNFALNGREKDLTQVQSELKWNDVFVWPNTLDNPGISVDMGIVFLPQDTRVDPETGSKYASEVKIIEGREKRVMVEDTALVDAFVEWGKKLSGHSSVKELFVAYKEEKDAYWQESLRKDCFTTFVHELQNLGFLVDASFPLANNLIGKMIIREDFDDQALKQLIRESQANWKRAEHTVSSKEFWDGFFLKNPHLRPKHLQYYEGDPTVAVMRFQQENNIGRADTSKQEGNLLGFDDHHLDDMQKDPRAYPGYNELLETAEKVISQRYSI